MRKTSECINNLAIHGVSLKTLNQKMELINHFSLLISKKIFQALTSKDNMIYKKQRNGLYKKTTGLFLKHTTAKRELLSYFTNIVIYYSLTTKTLSFIVHILFSALCLLFLHEVTLNYPKWWSLRNTCTKSTSGLQWHVFFKNYL